jgi:hypothetical protein
VFTGWLPVTDGTKILDRYHVEIEVPVDSNNGLPVVRETKGRIPRSPDRHMERDGKACVVLPDAYWHDHPNGMDLVEFIKGPLESYLASQSLLEYGYDDVWPQGEWQHGAIGVLQFYKMLLGFDDHAIIRDFVSTLAKQEIKGHWLCPCRSGEKLRKCHTELVRNLRDRIPRSVAADSERRIREHLGSASAAGRVG